ncbi:hypothetical protein PAMA_020655 [Pampus argenteus]
MGNGCRVTGLNRDAHNALKAWRIFQKTIGTCQKANYYRTGSIKYRDAGVQLSPAYINYYKLMAPAHVSPAAMATGPNLHCQTQFTVTQTTRPVVRVSSGVNTLSGSFPKSHSSQYSDLGVTRTPLSVDHSPDSGLVATPYYTEWSCSPMSSIKLPSSRFRFVSWHRLEPCDVTGDQLTCPRELNLSYQDLGDPFQQENFIRILRRLIRVEKLQLIDNSLTNLSSVRLPRCRILNLHRNHLVCLRQLPKLPAVEHLCLSENAIVSLGGLGALGNSPLRSLNLTRNPVTFTQDYRACVFSCLPKLEVLDGIPKLPEDILPTRLQFPETTRMCNIL